MCCKSEEVRSSRVPTIWDSPRWCQLTGFNWSTSIKNMIDKQWLNLSLASYKIKCKELFLNYGQHRPMHDISVKWISSTSGLFTEIVSIIRWFNNNCTKWKSLFSFINHQVFILDLNPDILHFWNSPIRIIFFESSINYAECLDQWIGVWNR